MVHVLDQRHQLGAFVTDTRFARFHYFKPILRRLNRCVGRVIGEVHEDRVVFALSIVDVVDTPFGNLIGRVARRSEHFTVFAKVIDAVAAVLVVVVDHVTQEAFEIVETAAIRRIGFLKAEMPFADERRMVACAF